MAVSRYSSQKHIYYVLYTVLYKYALYTTEISHLMIHSEIQNLKSPSMRFILRRPYLRIVYSGLSFCFIKCRKLRF